jgi:hypothetical protein
MKRLVLAILLAGLPAVAAGADIRFEAPTWDAPRYQIRLAFEVKSDPLTFMELLLEGIRIEPVMVFRAGKPADPAKPLDKGSYEIALDYAWASRKSYSFTVLFHGSDAAAVQKRAYSAISPAAGGIPPGSIEGFHRVYKVEEEAGLERTDEVVELTVTASRAALPAPEFRLFDGQAEIPFQLLDFRESDPVESVAKTNPPAATAKIVFPLSLGPNGRKLLLVLKGKPRPASPGGLSLTGENLGKALVTPFLSLRFHAQSGQILTVESPKEGIKLWNKAGVIHWNPDVFVPGVAWDHSFDWNPPASFEEKTGAVVYISARKGPMPKIKDVALEVRYRVDAFHPWFIAETRMVIEKDIGAVAVRNDEMVLYKELFDRLMYRAKTSEVVTMPLQELAEAPFGLVHVAPPDIPWLGLVNSTEKYGFFSLRLEAAASNLDVSGDFAHKSGTYFYAPSDGDYVYWVRPLIYTWADYATNNLLSFVPKGSFFYEKNAYVILRLDDRTPQELDRLHRLLKNPLRAF